MTNKSYFPLFFSLILSLLLLLAPRDGASAAFVCNNSWLTDDDGEWTDATKWSSGAAPIVTDDVCIDVPGTYTVTLNGARSVNSVTLGNATGVQTLLILGRDAGGAGSLSSAAGIDNSGTLTLDSINAAHSSDLTTGTLANLAGGVVNINQGAGGNRILSFSLTNDGTVNINADTTFSGTSTTYTNNFAFNIATGKTLSFTGNSNTFTQALN